MGKNKTEVIVWFPQNGFQIMIPVLISRYDLERGKLLNCLFQLRKILYFAYLKAGQPVKISQPY